MGGGKGSAPRAIDPGKAMGEYLFGKDFRKEYQGVTDPRLQEKLIAAEEEFRPRYSALELQDIQTFAQGVDGQGGLFDLLSESQRRARDIQAESLAQQRRADVDALREYAPQVVEAYREADPISTEIADRATARLDEDIGLADRGEKLLDTATEAEKKLLETGATLADLTPTEQEALLQKRGTQFIESTGELSPLQKRKIEQEARAGSMARGRLGDESSIYDESKARLAEELNKEQRDIMLGSQLLGQDFGMRMQRAGQGGQLLQAGQGIGFQRQGLGAGFIGQENTMLGQRIGQAFGMQRGIAGDLGSVILNRPSQSIALGQNILGQAQGQAAGPMGPQLFDPNVGINMALQQRGQDVEFAGMQAQARGAMIGGIAGGLGSYFGK